MEIPGKKPISDEGGLFKLSADQATDEIFRLDTDGTIQYANEAASRITGYPHEELPGMKIFALDPDLTTDTWLGIIRDLRKNRSRIRESRHRLKNGEIRDIGIAYTLVTDEGREYVFATIRDIPGPTSAQQDLLRISENRFRDLADLLPQIVFELDENLRFTFFNWNAIGITGYAYSDYDDLSQNGNGILAIIRELDRQPVEQFFASLQENVASGHTECGIVAHDGREFPAIIYASPIIGDERIAGIHGVIVDISEKIRLEKALEAMNLKLNLMNSVTRHDVLNNITGLLGLCDMLAEITTDSTAQGFVREIRNQVVKVKEQVIFTKDYQSVGVKAPQWQGVRKSITSAASAIGRDTVQVHLPGTDAEVYADPLFGKVFYNLIDNSFRHGGPVRNISVGTEAAPDGSLVIRYCDDGVGVPADEKELIFNQGYGKNTGFGLFIIREILGITGLAIRECGTPGNGVLFEITVPKAAWRPYTGTGVQGT